MPRPTSPGGKGQRGKASEDAFLFLDESLNVVSANAAAERLARLSRADLVGRSIRDVLPNGPEPAYDALMTAVRAGETISIDDIVVHPGGASRRLNVQAYGVAGGLGVVVRDAGEPEQAGDVSRQREELFRILLENVSDTAIVLNHDGTIRYKSPSLDRMVGRKRTSKNPFGFVHPDDLPEATRAFDHLRKTPGSEVHVEIRGQHRDGSWRTFDVTARNLLDDPAIAGIVVSFRDITEQRQAEDTLRRSEERFKALVENASDGNLILTADAFIAQQAPQVERKLGYDEGEVTGGDGFDFVHPDDLPGVRRVHAEVLRNPGLSVPFEMRVRGKDGSWRILEATGRNLLDNPAVEGIVINYRDVTDRRQAQEALRESEERFRALIENASDGIQILNGDGTFRYESPSMQRILGYEADCSPAPVAPRESRRAPGTETARGEPLMSLAATFSIAPRSRAL